MSETYRTTLPILTVETVTGKGKLLLDKARKKLGFVPNMYGAMAHSPSLLETYQLGYQRFREESGFSPVEQEVVLLTISFENGCDYCMAAHSMLADEVSKVPYGVSAAIRKGERIPGDSLRELAEFTRHVLHTRGRPTAEAAGKFLEAGYSDLQILEIILAVAVKTLSNYINHLFETPLDDAFEPYAWAPPEE